MQFVSLQFLIFIMGTIFIYFIIPKKVRYIWLLLASMAFYYIVSGKFLVFLIAVTLVTYGAGLLIEKNKEKAPKTAKLCLVLSIVLLVCLLGYFKYTGFLLETVGNIVSLFKLSDTMPVVNIILPAGISFYLFQSIGYLIDCYRGKIPAEKNYLRLALFISFFPQITSGPIERAGNMLPQFKEPKSFSYEAMRDGLLLMLWGYFQKIIIADRLAVLVNKVYESPSSYTGTVLFLATIFYTFEIYCDFAGYSCIAIGTARIMGIKIMDNFSQPYLSESVAEFWRRWHISLSTWFRDYLYIPLGGNRKGYVRKLINLMIVFAVSGLWHGAAWTFVVWGLLHGVFQVLGIVLKPVRDKLVAVFKIDRESFSHHLLKILVTFMLVNIGWIFFRADTFETAIYVLTHMWKVTLWSLTDGTLFTLGLAEADVRLVIMSLVLLVIVDAFGKKGIVIRDRIVAQSLWLRWLIYIVAIIFVVTCGVWGPGYDAATFIYSSF
ncbi:D-alanyl-lipoteichoic acid acyltransferase DltB, MBOAT superfamily [Butyrivibrio sp. INlla18]|uniref:MBOAT family O-acyltransferase n=1 Tax=Butyrivibrio sp. INlla18 TaxID=1520806 RepID=UPI00088D282F|nr:MBOAT family O-acyltransferase [Butyrivibrio sp. INlla18]SDA50968.1 D-alanyl-lipoteichoic acid acyltransferase DltB, MBOAT superfamily [Butyrivibrio sp. INlla18]